MMMSSAFVMAQDNYGFKVGGVDVTSDNYLDLTEINGVSARCISTRYKNPHSRQCHHRKKLYRRNGHCEQDCLRLHRQADWQAEGSGSGSISLISNLILDNCAITQPVGAEFDADQKAVVLNGELLKSKVVIEPITNSIGTVTADVPARKQGIYNLNGVKLTQQWNDLPAGIYIVDGVKRVSKQ